MLSKEEINYIENFCAEEMAYFGYRTSYAYGAKSLKTEAAKNGGLSGGPEEGEEVLIQLDNGPRQGANPGLTRMEQNVYTAMFKVIDRIVTRKLYFEE